MHVSQSTRDPKCVRFKILFVQNTFDLTYVRCKSFVCFRFASALDLSEAPMLRSKLTWIFFPDKHPRIYTFPIKVNLGAGCCHRCEQSVRFPNGLFCYTLSQCPWDANKSVGKSQLKIHPTGLVGLILSVETLLDWLNGFGWKLLFDWPQILYIMSSEHIVIGLGRVGCSYVIIIGLCWFGCRYVTIPVYSLSAFAVVSAICVDWRNPKPNLQRSLTNLWRPPEPSTNIKPEVDTNLNPTCLMAVNIKGFDFQIQECC